MIHLTNENLQELIKEGKVIVDFYADWCGPCKMLGPVLEQISSERSSLKVIKVNVDEHPELAQQYGVMSIPRVLVYQDNKLINDITGFVGKDEILKGLSE